MDSSNVKSLEKKGFSWLGFLFPANYYAGYGKLGTGMLFAVIGFIPLTLILVGVYAGFKAKKELPIKQIKFNWPKALLVFVLQIVIMATLFGFIQAIKDSQAQPSTDTNESQNVEYHSLSLDDLRLDSSQLENVRIAVKAKGSFTSGIFFIHKNVEDSNPVVVDISNLSREERKIILSRCNEFNLCNVTIYGVHIVDDWGDSIIFAEAARF